MTKKAFDKIAAGLSEAIAIARGEAKPAKLFVPPEIDVQKIRSKVQMSQDQFASTFGFTLHQIRQWEQRRVRPLDAARAYLMIIDRDPKAVADLLRKASAAARKKAA